jgi:hypothetical protein
MITSDSGSAIHGAEGYVIQVEELPGSSAETPDESISGAESLVVNDPVTMNTWPPSTGDYIIMNTPAKKGLFVRNDPWVDGEATQYSDGNKIAYLNPDDRWVILVATGEGTSDSEGYHWFQVQIPEDFRNQEWQSQNFGSDPLIGYVREDVVQLLMRDANGNPDWDSVYIPAVDGQ